MNKTIPLEYGKYYHIYNRGINGCDLFRYSDDYEHFFKLYDKYIFLIADIYAWVLMKNHFHFLVRIKEEDDIEFFKFLNSSRSNDAGRFKETNKWKTVISKDLPECEAPGSVDGKKKPIPYRQFSHLFNAYVKYFNKKYTRIGSLFEKNFERIEVSSEEYLRYLIYYIHHNPVHHGFTDDMFKYKWSSFLTINSIKPTSLKRQEVIELFDDLENFNFFHNQQHNLDRLKNYLFD